MPTTAFNPRGTSGSGKTTIVRAILQDSNGAPFAFDGRKIRAYRGELFGCIVYILGSYETTCGGCDTMVYDAYSKLIVDFMERDEASIVIYEGLMISHTIGRLGALTKKYGERHVMAFLDTPLDVCLERVQQRRDDRGTLTAFNPENTIKDHASVKNCMRNAIAQGFTVTTIDHRDAINASYHILYGLSELAKADSLDRREGEHTDTEGGAEAQEAVDR